MTDWTDINRGVRQGCVMSPDFFNLYSEIILRNLEDTDEGVIINGKRINNIRYADDTALVASSEAGLQRLLDVTEEKSLELGLEINCKKTFCMVVSKEKPAPRCTLNCSNTLIEQVDSLNYLGSLISSDGRSEKEIRRRIALSKSSFTQMQTVFQKQKTLHIAKNPASVMF